MVPADRTILNSWKEIATYMGRGVRTVQRWERHFHLPVHRPSGQPRSAVLAFSDEVDRWLAATPLTDAGGPATKRGLPPRTRELVASVRSRTVTLVRAAEKLQRNVMRAQAQQQRWRAKEPA
ncbi:MAG TPA: hypothetical protein VF493_10215 [Terriglobales bacterium]